jgi:hypothetical protein
MIFLKSNTYRESDFIFTLQTRQSNFRVDYFLPDSLFFSFIVNQYFICFLAFQKIVMCILALVRYRQGWK